jgi:DNA-directed RNA polymerase specialized sigma24 family protein
VRRNLTARLALVSPSSTSSGGASANSPVESAFRAYSPYVARVAIRLLGRTQDIEDVVQDVFLDAVSGLGKLRDPDAIRGWLATITVRVASRRLKI